MEKYGAEPIGNADSPSLAPDGFMSPHEIAQALDLDLPLSEVSIAAAGIAQELREAAAQNQDTDKPAPQFVVHARRSENDVQVATFYHPTVASALQAKLRERNRSNTPEENN